MFKKSLIIIVISVILAFFCLLSADKLEYLLPEEYKISNEDLEVVFIDVGQGDCILIITPNKKTVLIDSGGIPYWAKDYGLATPYENVALLYLSSRNIKVLNFVIITHPHGDHFGGMFDILSSLKIENFIDNGYTEGDPNYFDLLNIVDKKEIPYEQLKEGDFLEIDNEVFIKTFFPPKKGFIYEGANNSSLVFKLLYKNFSILFTGDIEIEAENYLCSRYKNEIKSTILKVPHHGSRTSSSRRFIKTVSAEAAVIMCGRNNLFGHPHQEVISRYLKFKVELYRTDIDGDIKILTNGKQYTIIPRLK
ncbi:MAG: ComEC/Rec2 family competence protein [Endomicrobiia bacterium]